MYAYCTILEIDIEVFYLNTIEQFFIFFKHYNQLEVCPYSRLQTGIPMMPVFQNLRWYKNKMTKYF